MSEPLQKGQRAGTATKIFFVCGLDHTRDTDTAPSSHSLLEHQAPGPGSTTLYIVQVSERVISKSTLPTVTVTCRSSALPLLFFKSSDMDYQHVQAWRIHEFIGIEQLHLVTSAIHPPKRSQVAVRLQAVSINFRDLDCLHGRHFKKEDKDLSDGGLIPCSDGAGEVVEVGEDVSEYKVGDRVITCFHANWESGPVPADIGTAALGVSRQGTLTSLGVYDAKGLVHCPLELSFEEAATLPCAAVTAWTALRDTPQPIGPESVVLVEGTGGVSVFAAQIALAAGSRVIATSSSDDKLRVYRNMGVSDGDLINYSRHKDWSLEVRKLVPEGVDHVVEVAGQLQLALKAVKRGGVVSNIGYLSEGEGVTCVDLLRATANVRSTAVGSRHSLIQLSKTIKRNGFKPVIDKVFKFQEAREAFKYVEAGKHVGKVVIQVYEAQ